MAPRWVKTKDHAPSLYRARQTMTTSCCCPANFVVGRVLLDQHSPQRGRYAWSLTGTSGDGAPVARHGMTDTLARAQAALLASWRAWQAWAAVRDVE
jgi:hypothetical protein